MNNTLKYLTLLLVVATLASAETKSAKESAKPAPASHAAVAPGPASAGGAKPSPAKPNPDGNVTEVGYGVNPIEPSEKSGTGVGFFQTQTFFLLLLVLLLGVLMLLGYLLWPRKKLPAPALTYPATVLSSAGSSSELQQLNQSIASINVRLQNITAGQTSIASNITTLGSSLASKVAEAAVTALTNSDLGKAKKKIETLEGELFTEKASARQAVEESGRFSEESSNLKAETERAVKEKLEAVAKCEESGRLIQKLDGELTAERISLQDAKTDAANERKVAVQLRAEANKPYEVLAPAKLKSTELGAQMLDMYQASLSGDVAAIAAWTTLTTFASAQADPAAKDFQLQIVRRLGFALVGYWKHQSLSEKDRHEKLSHWAKSLNENADSRFNLLVPGLGEPIDKTRMTCATSSTAIREVLCWQVRNPSGASFSLAEVA
jgi:hypothetical protein